MGYMKLKKIFVLFKILNLIERKLIRCELGIDNWCRFVVLWEYLDWYVVEFNLFILKIGILFVFKNLYFFGIN